MIRGDHAYASDGTYTVGTRIVDEAGVETIVTSVVQSLTPVVHEKHSVTVEAKPGVPTGDVVVGSLLTNTQRLPAGDVVSATIEWGDGTTTPGTITYGGSTIFRVNGSHQYAKAGNYVFHVTVNGFGAPVVMEGTAHVKGPAPAISGWLDGKSDTGVSKIDGITNDTTPTFTGTTTPGATVELYAWPKGNGKRFLIARGKADAQGRWVLASSTLSDGTYTISAHALAPDGGSASTKLEPGGQNRLLVVDTTAPRIKRVSLDPARGRARIDFSDAVGMDPRGMSVHTRYVFGPIQGSRWNSAPVKWVGVAVTTDRSVTLGLGGPVPDGQYMLRVVSAGVRDQAGNVVDGEFAGTFRTGDHRPGGDFFGLLTVAKQRLSKLAPVVSQSRTHG